MSGALLALAVALGGGAGAAGRMVLDGLVKARVGGGYPWGTTLINVTGSFLLGMVTGLVAVHGLASGWGVVIGTGVLGGYTTFSTASYETVRLVQARRWRAATANGFGMLLVALAAAALGLWAGSAW